MLSVLLLSCEEQGSVGTGIFDDPISFTITDTLTFDSATVLMDSVVTQGVGSILFGSYHDEFLGNVTADGFLKFSLGPGSFIPGQSARYDSLTLRMNTHYHYGDTTQMQQVRIYRVAEDIEPNDDEDSGFLYNFNFFDHELQSIGEFTFLPERGNEIEVTISDQLGMVLFEAAQDEDDIITGNDEFQDFFKGIVLKGNEQVHTAITGVVSEETEENGNIVLRLYYSDLTANDTRIEEHYDFQVVSNSSFTHIRSQKPDPLHQLVNSGDAVESTETDNQVFVQSGIGIMTRIDFDDTAIEKLHNLSSNLQVLIAAHLYLFPLIRAYDFKTPLPQELSLLLADNQNRITGEIQQASAGVDHEFHNDTYYQFDITEFIEEKLQTERFTGNGLLLTTPPSIYNRTVDRVVLGDGEKQDYQMVLIITFAEINL